MVLKTAVQLYTFRQLNISLPAIIELTGRAGFDGVELAFRAPNADPEQVVTALETTDQVVAAAHVPLKTFEQDTQAVIQRYKKYNCDCLVTYTLDEEHFSSEETTIEFVDRIQSIADAVNNAGLEFCYHNHDVEFTEVNGTPALNYLIDQLDRVAWEIDAGWVAAAGYDPVDIITDTPDVHIVHAKDMDIERSTPVEIGNGDIDFDAVAKASNKSGADWLVYEHDFADNPLLSVDRGGRALNDLVTEL